MKLHNTFLCSVIFLGHCLGAAEITRLDTAWSFALGDPANASQPGFNDADWRKVDLPHDWSIESAPDKEAPGAGDIGYFPTGLGWYRRQLDIPAKAAGRHLVLRLDGACTHAEVWVNGSKLAYHPYGYTPTDVVLDGHLKPGPNNTLAVRIDNSVQPNSRWYTGSGLCRGVTLHESDPVHIPLDGLRLTTTALGLEGAALSLECEVGNTCGFKGEAVMDFQLQDSSGTIVHRQEARIRLDGTPRQSKSLDCRIPGVQAWSDQTPVLYTARVTVSVPGKFSDTQSTEFGFRTVEWNASQGLLLNGKPVKLLGSNVHHDNGPLGAAAYEQADERKVRQLKEAGFNAVRCSHNPPSPAFLRACDRLGLFVMNEAFDGWAKKKVAKDYALHFKEWWKHDLTAMLRRDHNHPSVVMWSIGNELFERGGADGFEIARQLTGQIRTLDRSRPITAGINDVPNNWKAVDGLFSCLDIAGYNYELRRHADDRKRFPNRVIICTESYQYDHYDYWKIMQEAPYVVGDFVWSGIDYLGEAGIGRVFPPGEEAVAHWKAPMWPWHGAACGDIDLTGWRKPVSHYRNIIWNRGETTYAAVRVPTPDGRPWNPTLWTTYPSLPSWTWPGFEGKNLDLEVCSRREQVRVYVNGRLHAERTLGEQAKFQALIPVPYEPGRLEIVGLDKGVEMDRQTLVTTGPLAEVRLQMERATPGAPDDGLVYVFAELVDAAGNRIYNLNTPITWGAGGGAVFLGCASSDYTKAVSYQSPTREAHQGRAMAVFKLKSPEATATITVRAEGLQERLISIDRHK